MKKILSLLLLAALGFILYLWWYIHSGSKHIPPHFHANFALYVNWERIDFTDEKFSEDIAGCSITGKKTPEDRAHLHERNQDTIHIHDEGVAWGHFFSNNGIVFSEDSLIIWSEFWEQAWKYFSTEQDSTISFVKNWRIVKNPFNTLIWSKDRLLISYWDQSEEELMKLYETVSNNAGEYNEKYDPGSCGWTNENGILVLLTEWLHWIHKMDH